MTSLKPINLKWLFFVILFLLSTINSIAQTEPPKHVIDDYAKNVILEYVYGDGSFKERIDSRLSTMGYSQKEIEAKIKSISNDKIFREHTYEVFTPELENFTNRIGDYPVSYPLNTAVIVRDLTRIGKGMAERNAVTLADYIFSKKIRQWELERVAEEKKQKELTAKQKAEEEKRQRIIEEQRRIAEEKRKKEAFDRFMIDRKNHTYIYEDYNRSHFSNLKAELIKSIFNFIAEKENSLENIEINITLNIDTNSNTTYMLDNNKRTPKDLNDFVESLLHKIKLAPCIDPVHNISVNATGRLNFSVTRLQNEYTVRYFNDGLYLESGDEDGYEQYKQKILDDLKDKNNAYGKYNLRYDITKVNDTHKESVKYTSYRGLGGASNALLSVVVPGLGNKFVSRSKSSGWYINTIGIIGLAGAGTYYKIQSADNYNNYQAAFMQNEMDKFYDDANKQNKLSYTLFGAAAAWWVYDIISVGIKGGKNSAETKRMDKKIHTVFSPSYIDGTYGIALQLKF